MSDSFLKNALRAPAQWPKNLSKPESRAENRKVAQAFLEKTYTHGVQPWIYSLQKNAETSWRSWPREVKQALEREFKGQSLHEGARRQELDRVFGLLYERKIPFLVLKGEALARSHYPRAPLRPRADTDVLIQKKDLKKVCRILGGNGYRAPSKVSGEFVSYQLTLAKKDSEGFEHILDLHWKLSNSQFLTAMLPDSEIWAEAQGTHDLPTLSPRHALLLCCFHRVSHHHNDEDLIWLLDIHLVTSRLSKKELGGFMLFARQKGVSRICFRGLELASQWFGTKVDLHWLESQAARPGRERSEALMAPDLRWLDEIVFEMRSLKSWQARAALLKEHVFPPADYMLAKYHANSRALLPVLYGKRLIAGVKRLLSKA